MLAPGEATIDTSYVWPEAVDGTTVRPVSPKVIGPEKVSSTHWPGLRSSPPNVMPPRRVSTSSSLLPQLFDVVIELDVVVDAAALAETTGTNAKVRQ
jgi:hypothetical protein